MQRYNKICGCANFELKSFRSFKRFKGKWRKASYSLEARG